MVRIEPISSTANGGSGLKSLPDNSSSEDKSGVVVISFPWSAARGGLRVGDYLYHATKDSWDMGLRSPSPLILRPLNMSGQLSQENTTVYRIVGSTCWADYFVEYDYSTRVKTMLIETDRKAN